MSCSQIDAKYSYHLHRIGERRGRSSELCLAHSHVSARSVTLSDYEVATRVVIPRHIEVTAGVVVELDIGKVVGPVLNRIESALTLLETWLRSSNSHTDQSRDCAENNSSEGKHVGGKSRRIERVADVALLDPVDSVSAEPFYSFSSTRDAFSHCSSHQH
jgi:hypothetical protein